MKIATSILTLAMCASLPLGAAASDKGGGDSHPAPVVRSEPAPVVRSEPAPVVRSEPAPISRPAPITRTAPLEPGPSIRQPVRPPGTPAKQPLPIYQARTPAVSPPNNARPAPNPNTSAPWAWNGGDAWLGYDTYWGNGFWGQLAYGLSAAAYIVAANSPGAKLLQAYDLRQTPCGPPDLVEIIGPDNSEICAYPNALVAPGVYYVDPNTLTLYSQPPDQLDQQPTQ